MGARKRAPASGRPPRRGGGGGEIPADGGGAGGGELPGDDGGRGKGGPDDVKSNITEPSGRAARVIETYHGIGGSPGGDGGGGTPGGKGHAAEASGRPARGSESEDGTGGTPRSDGGAGSGRIPGGSGAGGRRLHGDSGKEDAETIAKFRAANEEDRPFSGLLVLCIDFTSYKSTEQKTTKGQKVEQGTRTTDANMDEWLESYQDYKQKVEALGGTFGSGFNYSQATHIAVMGEIPPGARAFWEIESKEVTKIDWIDQCYKERKLLPIEAKGRSENLICQTPVSTKSFDRKCLSTSTKELKHSTRNKTRAPKKLDFSGQRSIYHRHLVCEAETEVTEKLYDYALRYKMHEYCELPGCGDALCHEQEIIIIPKSVRISKLSTKLILMRCFHRLASLHNDGYFLGGKYSSRNYHIYCDDSVKLQDIDGEIVKYNDENGDLDYTQFVHMLEQEVFLNQELPFDLTEWLRIISQGVRACHRALLCNHVDLMEPFQAYGHFIAIYQIFWNVKGTPGWADLLDSLGHYSGWMDGYIECSFIDQTLRYNDDNIGQAVDYENDVRGLLRALNNTFKHRAKAHQSLAIYIIMNEFREFLSDLQRALHQGGYLSHLRL